MEVVWRPDWAFELHASAVAVDDAGVESVFILTNFWFSGEGAPGCVTKILLISFRNPADFVSKSANSKSARNQQIRNQQLPKSARNQHESRTKSASFWGNMTNCHPARNRNCGENVVIGEARNSATWRACQRK
jgi:hypothetical protein